MAGCNFTTAWRAATRSSRIAPPRPLELFFDLTFVVAVAQAADGLHHGLIDGHAAEAMLGFPLVFFGIWWAWMNFTWFASAYDTDDAVYRLATLVQITGVLIVAAGVPRALDGHDFGIMTLGYVTMRLAMVGQWLRAAASHPDGRPCALRYAGGITALQVGWVLRLALHDGAGMVGFVVLVALEMAVPLWAESRGRTSWHPGHIAERYGLFTLIVLGESVLASTVAVQVALDGTTAFSELAPVVVGGILIVFFMWWMYFDMPAEQAVTRIRSAFVERPSGRFLLGLRPLRRLRQRRRRRRRPGRGRRPGHPPLQAVRHPGRLRHHRPGGDLRHRRLGPPLPPQGARADAQLRRPRRGGAHPGVELHPRAGAGHRPPRRHAGRRRRHRRLLRARGAGVGFGRRRSGRLRHRRSSVTDDGNGGTPKPSVARGEAPIDARRCE